MPPWCPPPPKKIGHDIAFVPDSQYYENLGINSLPRNFFAKVFVVGLTTASKNMAASVE